MDKEELFIKRVRELANIAYQRDITTFTDFLNLNEQNILNSQNLHKLGVTVEGFGGYENAERQMVAFHPVQGKTYNGCCIENQRSGKYSRAETESDYRNMCICALGFSDRTGFWDIQEQYRALY